MAGGSWPSTHLSMLLGMQNPQNDAAWAEFMARYRPPIVDFCRRRLGYRSEDAEDVAQRVLLTLLKEMQKFEYKPSGSFRAWLRQVARNAVLKFVDSERKRPDVAKGGSSHLDDWIKTTSAEGDELSEVITDSLRHDLVREAERLVKDRVDTNTWQAYEMRKAGTRAKEIAGQLELKVAAIHKAFSRVKQMLREEIAMLLKSR